MHDVALSGVQNLTSNAWLRLCGVLGFGFRVLGFEFWDQNFTLTAGRSRSGLGRVEVYC